jgi:hypothetical protein
MGGFFALLDPLLRRPALVVEAADGPVRPGERGDDDAPPEERVPRGDARPWRAPAEAGPRRQPDTGRCDSGPAGRGRAGRGAGRGDPRWPAPARR